MARKITFQRKQHYPSYLGRNHAATHWFIWLLESISKAKVTPHNLNQNGSEWKQQLERHPTREWVHRATWPTNLPSITFLSFSHCPTQLHTQVDTKTRESCWPASQSAITRDNELTKLEKQQPTIQELFNLVKTTTPPDCAGRSFPV